MKSELVRRILINVASILCTVGGGVLGLVGVKRDISRLVSLPAGAYRTMLVIGIVFIAIGAIAFLASLLVRPATRVIGSLFGDHLRHKCTYATPADVPILHALYTEYFQGDVASPSLMRSWLQCSPKALAMIHRVDHWSPRKHAQELVGSFKVLMLNDRGIKGIEAGDLSGATLGTEHIVRHLKDTKGYYVGDVVATTWRARAAVLANLNVACERAVRDGKPIYARPLTPDGKRVMTKHGFVQVTGGDKPQIGKMCILLAAEMGGGAPLEEASVRQRERGLRSRLVRKTAKSPIFKDLHGQADAEAGPSRPKEENGRA